MKSTPVIAPRLLENQSIHVDVTFHQPKVQYHVHSSYELVYTQGSFGEHLIGDSISHFDSSGDLLLLGPWLPHGWSTTNQHSGQSSTNVKNIAIHFTPDTFGTDFLDIPDMISIRSLLQHACQGIQFSKKTVAEIIPHLDSFVSTTTPAKIIRLLLMLELLSRSVHRKILVTQSYIPTTNEHDHTKFSHVLNRILDIEKPPHPIDKIAKEVNMSRSSFTRFFKRMSGKSYINYINEWRVKRACHLLEQSDSATTISDISRESGFDNLSHFNRQFLKITGVSPSQYKSKEK